MFNSNLIHFLKWSHIRIMAENRQELNRNLAQMLKGGVIMDVTTPEQAKILGENLGVVFHTRSISVVILP